MFGMSEMAACVSSFALMGRQKWQPLFRVPDNLSEMSLIFGNSSPLACLVMPNDAK